MEEEIIQKFVPILLSKFWAQDTFEVGHQL